MFESICLYTYKLLKTKKKTHKNGEWSQIKKSIFWWCFTVTLNVSVVNSLCCTMELMSFDITFNIRNMLRECQQRTLLICLCVLIWRKLSNIKLANQNKTLKQKFNSHTISMVLSTHLFHLLSHIQSLVLPLHFNPRSQKILLSWM